MMQIDFLREIIEHQRKSVAAKGAGMDREKLKALPDLESYALILSGIRRSGKSTLLYQLLQKRYKQALYLNFDDPRLYEFEPEDFLKLDVFIKDNEFRVLMFDEIQIIKGWERYVRQKLDEGFKVFVTGSNASLLSRELGTSLTGRHITNELFPFSFSEFCRFHKLKHSVESVKKFMIDGGFPEYQKQKNEEILTQLLEDILVRDIAVRYNIRDVKTLQRLTLFLMANVGNRISGNKLKSNFGISSATTILEYFSYLEQSYLLSFVPMFDYSIKRQNVNPKKVYAIDTGLVNMTTPRFKSDSGHILENMVFLVLRRLSRDVFYYAGAGECDFVVMEKGVISQAVQVCFDLNRDNLKREISGLCEAATKFELRDGVIVTLSQTDHFVEDGVDISVLPFHVFAMQKR
jgi:hypothetical protein